MWGIGAPLCLPLLVLPTLARHASVSIAKCASHSAMQCCTSAVDFLLSWYLLCVQGSCLELAVSAGALNLSAIYGLCLYCCCFYFYAPTCGN
jgi:hypothetical protein